jgi:hypothetical protein
MTIGKNRLERMFYVVFQLFSSHTTSNSKNLCYVIWYVGPPANMMGDNYANRSTTMFVGDKLYEGTCGVLILTEEFAVDPDTCLRWGKQTLHS